MLLSIKTCVWVTLDCMNSLPFHEFKRLFNIASPTSVIKFIAIKHMLRRKNRF